MKDKLSYIVMSVIFFNILFVFYYYFKIVDFFYIYLFDFNALINIVFVNLGILIIDIVHILVYELFNLYRLSYLSVAFFGVIIGVLFSLLILGLNSHGLNDYLAIASFFIMNTIFISYSLSFDQEKKIVFE